MNQPMMRTDSDGVETTQIESYQRAFQEEAALEYPGIAAFERATGYAVRLEKLLDAARVLACPVKINPPSWQHGRVIYSVCMSYLACSLEPGNFLNVGTAKGFSALCMRWAATDSLIRKGVGASIVSVDVIDPHARVHRNTVAEVAGPLTLAETLEPWPEAEAITFLQSDGAEYLKKGNDRVTWRSWTASTATLRSARN